MKAIENQSLVVVKEFWPSLCLSDEKRPRRVVLIQIFLALQKNGAVLDGYVHHCNVTSATAPRKALITNYLSETLFKFKTNSITLISFFNQPNYIAT
jgi:hypothetical protein